MRVTFMRGEPVIPRTRGIPGRSARDVGNAVVGRGSKRLRLTTALVRPHRRMSRVVRAGDLSRARNRRLTENHMRSRVIESRKLICGDQNSICADRKLIFDIEIRYVEIKNDRYKPICGLSKQISAYQKTNVRSKVDIRYRIVNRIY